MTRGKKSNVTIAGHTLTWAELTVLRQLQGYLDGQAKSHRAPFALPLREIFASENAKLYCARRLASLGVLSASGIELVDDFVKGKPHDTIPAV